MNKYKITIVTVTYNCVKVIGETIKSVISQNYPLIEYIIIDGNSTDGTTMIVEKFQKYISKYISEPDNGIFEAMNKGIKMADGDWIIFMNAGDRFVNNHVISDIFHGHDYETFGVIHGDYYSTFKGKETYHRLTPFYKRTDRYRGMGFSHQATFVKVSLAKNHPFDLRFKLSADYNMIWNLYYNQHIKFMQLSIPVAIMEAAEGATVRYHRRHLNEVCDICGIMPGLYRTFLINYKLIRYRLQHLKSNFMI